MTQSLIPILVAMLTLFVVPAIVQAVDLMGRPLAEHPRLFATTERWGEIAQAIKTDDVARQLAAVITAQADGMLTEPLVKLEKQGRRLLTPIRQVQGRVITLAMAARLTGDARYATRAIEEMRALASLADWNPSHFLDAAEATLAIAVGYDWLYDGLSAADRSLFEDAIIDKGLRPSFPPAGEKDQFWVRGRNNWNQVCHGGLTIGALAVAERAPELSASVVERAVADLRFGAAAYAPDGVYPEGAGYWQYGTSFHVAMVAALESAMGSRFKLDEFEGFRQSATYIQQMLTPTDGVFNYSDNGPRRGFYSPLFWFARAAGNAALVEVELNRLRSVPATDAQWKRGEMLFPLALIWWNPAMRRDTTTAPLSWLGRGQVPVAVHRSAWGDRNASFVAIKGGSPSASHGHMDVGSFILESDGVRWAVDLGAQDYNSLESVGVKIWNGAQDGQRWQVFVLGVESHNILRFNDGPQLVKGSAEIVRFSADGSNPHSICDLTPVYANEVADAQRGVSLRADRRVLIQDEWTARADRPANVAFQWMTLADVQIDGRSVTLKQSGRQLTLRIMGSDDVTIEVQDPSKLTKPYDKVDPKVRRIVIKTRTESAASGRLAILAEPQSATSREEVPFVPLQEW